MHTGHSVCSSVFYLGADQTYPEPPRKRAYYKLAYNYYKNMLVGVSSRLLWDVEENLSVNLGFISKNAGLAELWMMPPFFPSWRTPDMKGDLDRLRDALTVYGLPTTIHAPHHDMNLASLNPAAASCALREVEKCLEVADMLGSSVVTFHPGGFKYRRERGLQVLASNLRRLDVKARDYSALLCLENMEQDSMYCREASEVVELLAGLEYVNVTLDLAHALSLGADVGSWVGGLGGRIRHIHVADFRRGEHRHLPIGDGELGFRGVFESLRDSGYRGAFVLEGVSSNPYGTIPRDVVKLKQMLSEAGFT